jgi:hypothetical protein
MSEEYFNYPAGYGLKYVHKYDDPGEFSGVLLTILHWVEELKQWRCGKNKDDYDEDIGTLKDKDDDIERERERDDFGLLQEAWHQIYQVRR